MDNQEPNPDPSPSQEQGNKTQRLRIHVVAIVISVLVYLAACAVPCLEFIHTDSTHDEILRGAQVLAMGWCGIFLFNFAWFANFIYIASLILLGFRRYKESAISAAVAFLIGLDTFLLWGHVWLADEAGVKHFQLKDIHTGVYLWLLSIFIVIPLAYICKKQDNRKAK